MEADDSALLVGAEIHGFRTVADLNVAKLMEDASKRWFRPNEVYAMLSNYTRFKIQPQPIDNPPSGSVLLFDRKMLRNFRKDGHNWKKKKDGKTVQEAHEKLKIGNEERIHVYYAHSEDDPSFYRRCYWLLDKNLERIVLVHYRETSEDNVVQHLPAPVECPEASSLKDKLSHGSPSTTGNSTSGSAHSEMSGLTVISEEINSGEHHAICTDVAGSGVSLLDAELRNHEKNLHEINTLDWADLVESPTNIDLLLHRDGDASSYAQKMQNGLGNSMNHNVYLPPDDEATGAKHPTNGVPSNDFNRPNQTNGYNPQMAKYNDIPPTLLRTANPNSQLEQFETDVFIQSGSSDVFTDDVFQSQHSFGRWNCMNDDTFGFLDDLQLQTLSSDENKQNLLTTTDQFSPEDHLFNVTDISPGWAYSMEDTKILVVGYFSESCKHLIASSIYCVFGGICVAAEMVQPGVYRCTALPQPPGVVNLFLTLDGHTPISQVLSFDYRSSPTVKLDDEATLSEYDNKKLNWRDYEMQTRLAYLLFKSTDSLSVLSSRMPPKSLKEAKRFALLTSPILEKDWMNMLKLGSSSGASSSPACQNLLELVLRNKLQEWLLERIADGCKTTARDNLGQGVIHLCAVLDYAWSVRFFALSSLSLDFRDTHGWTALHWAAYCGREKMVAALLSAGANPSLVTDPTPEFPGGCTAADLASKQGYEGLGAYLAEKGLTAHFQAMSLSGNAAAPETTSSAAIGHFENSWNLSEQELCLQESLAAYRNAADAADRIQAAFRERALKLQAKAIELARPEMEATQIIAALKIQHAFRNYHRKKKMKAAARIQSHFRTWKTRKIFLHTRRQVVKIQAAFRGHQVRKQYRKIIWSVGVLEKAILRWRLKRKGLRGIQVKPTEAMNVDIATESTGEEDFYRISREQAEERVRRSVVRVQAMFRSYRAQQEYRRMKLAHEHAKLEFSELSQYQ